MANGVIAKGGELPCPVDSSGVFTDPVTDFKNQYVKVCMGWCIALFVCELRIYCVYWHGKLRVLGVLEALSLESNEGHLNVGWSKMRLRAGGLYKFQGKGLYKPMEARCPCL